MEDLINTHTIHGLKPGLIILAGWLAVPVVLAQALITSLFIYDAGSRIRVVQRAVLIQVAMACISLPFYILIVSTTSYSAAMICFVMYAFINYFIAFPYVYNKLFIAVKAKVLSAAVGNMIASASMYIVSQMSIILVDRCQMHGGFFGEKSLLVLLYFIFALLTISAVVNVYKKQVDMPIHAASINNGPPMTG